MTRLKNREPATDLPPASTSPNAAAANLSAVSLLEDKPPADKPSKTEQTTQQSAQSDSAIAPQNPPQPNPPQPSRPTSGWRKLGSAIKRHPNVSQTLLFLMLIGGTSAVLLTLLFRDAWSDRYNNVAVLSTILKMELNREDARILEGSPDRVVTHTFRTLEPHVEADGWEWMNRFGNTITYGRQDQRMIASCSAYSPLYMICDLGEISK